MGCTELQREGALWVSVRVHSQYVSEPCPASLLQHARDVDGFDGCAQFLPHGVISDPSMWREACVGHLDVALAREATEVL